MKNTNPENPMRIKYVIRRFIFSVITTPVVALANFLFWAVLIGYGAGPGGDFKGATGMLMAAWVVCFTFWPLFDKWIYKELHND